MKKLIYSFLTALSLLSLSVTGFSQVIQGTYAIKNVQTGILLRIKDANTKNGTPLVAYSPVNWKCVTWDFNHIDGETYQLRNLFTGKTFQPERQQPSEGVALNQQPLVAKQADQLYEFIPVEKNVYLIRLKGTDLYLTPSDDKGAINSRIILAAKMGGRLQQWTIYEQSPTI